MDDGGIWCFTNAPISLETDDVKHPFLSLPFLYLLGEVSICTHTYAQVDTTVCNLQNFLKENNALVSERTRVYSRWED